MDVRTPPVDGGIDIVSHGKPLKEDMSQLKESRWSIHWWLMMVSISSAKKSFEWMSSILSSSGSVMKESSSQAVWKSWSTSSSAAVWKSIPSSLSLSSSSSSVKVAKISKGLASASSLSVRRVQVSKFTPSWLENLVQSEDGWILKLDM